MSDYDQSNQNVTSQYNAGRDIIIVSKTGQRLTLKVLKSDYKAEGMGFLGSAASVEFQLANHHTIRYKRDAGLMSTTIMFYVDGKQLLRREIFNPVQRIEFPFEIEDIDCEFMFKAYAVTCDIRVRVGGHEILSV